MATDDRVRRAGLAGLLLPAPVLAVVAVVLTVGENLRQYGIPWLLVAAIALLGICLDGVHLVQAPRSGSAERAGHVLTQVGLTAIAAFFTLIGLEDVVDRLAGTGRFLSDHGTVTATGTLLASVGCLVVLPLGLVLLGIGSVSAAALPGRTAWLPASIPVILVAGPLVASTTGSAVASVAWVSLIAMIGVTLGMTLRRSEAPAPAARVSRAAPARNAPASPASAAARGRGAPFPQRSTP